MSDVEPQTGQGIEFTDDEKSGMNRLAARVNDPTFVQDLRTILDRALVEKPVSGDSYFELQEQMNDYFGGSVAEVDLFLRLMLVKPGNWPQVSALASLVTDEKARSALLSFVSRIRALYATLFSSVVRAAGETPDDWMSARFDLSYVVAKEAWQIDTRIRKYTGETLLMQCSLSSLISLVTFMVNAMNQVPSAEAPRGIPASKIDELRAEVSQLVASFSPVDGGPDTAAAAAPVPQVAAPDLAI